MRLTTCYNFKEEQHEIPVWCLTRYRDEDDEDDEDDGSIQLVPVMKKEKFMKVGLERKSSFHPNPGTGNYDDVGFDGSEAEVDIFSAPDCTIQKDSTDRQRSILYDSGFSGYPNFISHVQNTNQIHENREEIELDFLDDELVDYYVDNVANEHKCSTAFLPKSSSSEEDSKILNRKNRSKAKKKRAGDKAREIACRNYLKGHNKCKFGSNCWFSHNYP